MDELIFKRTTVLLLSTVVFFAFGNTLKAASMDESGFGEVLIYPYYTVNENLNTLFSVVNTTDDVKALKIKFLEGDNAQEVLNFNLYMSPKDVWSAALVAQGDGVELITTDTSCVALADQSTSFTTEFFIRDSGEDGSQRMRDGHFQIIEMGTVIDPVLGMAATQFNGRPHDCGAIEAAWQAGGQWAENSDQGMAANTGGLFGSALIVDVREGSAMSYRADAIKGFYSADRFMHTEPNNFEPTLASAAPVSTILYDDKAYVSHWNLGTDAISALLMRDKIHNEFVLASGIDAQTEFIVTFPTKHFYTQPENGPENPFTQTFSSVAGACEGMYPQFYDRESVTVDINPCGGIICPPLPEFLYEMCWSANVIHFYNSAEGMIAEVPSPILGSTNLLNFKTTPFSSGWVSFSRSHESAVLTDAESRWSYRGWPVTGFAVQKYTNSGAQPGLLAQYATVIQYAYTRNIQSALP